MLKNRLNEFEKDWASLPQVEKELISRLKNKRIAVSGHTIARCLCYALIYQNEVNSLGAKIVYAYESESELKAFYEEAKADKSFESVRFNSLAKLSGIDLFIHTGFCRESLQSFSTALKTELKAAKSIAEAAAKNGAKVVLLSDSRAYGGSKPNRVYAENEYAELSPVSPDSLEAQLIRTVEAYFQCGARQMGFELVTLRPGYVLGAECGLGCFLDEVFRAVANSTDYALFNSSRKYSFIYITDLFGAVFFAAEKLSGGVFNVCGADCTASTGLIAAKLHDIYGSRAKVTIGKSEDIPYCAVSDGKLRNCGFEPAINLETALELCVMSYMPQDEPMLLPHTHDGRLDAIQKIQLAYLLEVDRLCRRHNIKYFLGGGTLLGAVRHKGFIPWDDDSDIMMLREDYDRFCRIAQTELPAGMTFQSGKTDRHCFYEFAKLRVDGTAFATGFSKEHREMHNGIALDIFCHDKTANSAFGRKLHLALTLFTRALVFNKWNNRRADNGSRVQSAVTNLFVRLLPLRFSYWLMNRTISFFKRKKNAKYLYDGMGRNVYNGAFPADYLDKAVYTDFEGCKLPVPEKYDEYLTFLYGDYMELAPLSTRLGCHEILLCDIGKYDSLKK